MSLTHGERGSRAGVVEYKSDVFGLALVVVSIINGRRDAESSVRPILDKWWSWVHIAQGGVDDVLVCTCYYNWRCG